MNKENLKLILEIVSTVVFMGIFAIILLAIFVGPSAFPAVGNRAPASEAPSTHVDWLTLNLTLADLSDPGFNASGWAGTGSIHFEAAPHNLSIATLHLSLFSNSASDILLTNLTINIFADAGHEHALASFNFSWIKVDSYWGASVDSQIAVEF